jgi:peptidyl-prolyl cis-trans isomerase SurA
MKMKQVFFTLTILAASFSSIAQSSDIILKVEDEQVTREDFESIFRKNNRDSVITTASLDEYMELFINFKLKVRAAMEAGLDTSSSFQRELLGYRKQLARPYLVDQALLDELIEEAYERQKQEVRASHILIKCDPNASPADTLKAYERIVALRDRIVNGESFEAVATAKNGSQDPSVRDNKGDLGYFSAFQMVYPFEEAAFNTAVGEISAPVRTNYGYHILQVNDKRDARGEILAAHIMIRVDEKNPTSKMEGEEKINEIYALLKEGNDFSELSVKYSDDPSTAKRGGELPWFGTGKMVEEFENAAFSLENNGDISAPFLSPYGWHIVKRIDYKPIPDFKSAKNDIKSKVSRDARAELTKSSFLKKLRKEYAVEVDQKCMKAIYKAADADSAFLGKGLGTIKSKTLQKPLLTIDGKSRSVESFVNKLNNAKIRDKRLSSKEIVDQQLEAYINSELMDYEDSRLEEKYNDFRLLMNEYHDGILLFELTDEKVWSKAVKDTLGLQAYYEANKADFMWEERADVVIYTCKNAKVAKALRKAIQKGKDLNAINDELNETTRLNFSYEEDVLERSEKEIFDKITWEEGLSENIEEQGQIVIVQINEIIPAAPKTLEEARGLITAEYQNYLEAEWIKELRAKYSFEVNESVLHSIK